MTTINHLLTKKPIVVGAIFLLALAVRLPQLGAFFTADEFLWVDRSRNFLGGLLSPDFACLLPQEDQTNAVPGRGLQCTLRTGHPGVITMWTGALGLWLQWLTGPEADSSSLLAFVERLPTNPVAPETIAPVRLPTAVLTSLFVGLFYLLLTRLFKADTALLAALLLALNPFHVALSRVLHHDALSTIFMIISALSAIIYFGVDRRRRWLILAGGMAGLTMLTKSTGFFLIPYTGLLALWSLAARWARAEVRFLPALRATIGEGLIWLGLTVFTFWAVWPAMWVIPLQVLNTIYTIGFKYASGGHAKGVLFFGQVFQDPGPFFYPVTWLFRTNFWAMLGALAAAGLAVGALRRRSSPQLRLKGWLDKLSPRGFDDRTGLLLWVGAFLFFFSLAMILGEKKQDRYLLPVYPMLDLVAAVGLLALLKRIPLFQRPQVQPHLRRAWLMAVVMVNLALLLPRYPYYFTSYNPLLGGLKTASRVITVGWGEGLNLAAAYLNAKPEAEKLRVSTWYGSTFAPFFKGTTIRYSDQKGNALGGQYIIFYLNQLQRDYPDGEIWRYAKENFSLEQTIALDGVDYVWIFTGPAIDHYLEDQRYNGIAALLGWDWSGPANPDAGPLPAGSRLDYALFWEYLGKTPEEDFFLRLIGPDDRVWAEAVSRPTAQFADSTAWRPGQIIKEQGQLHLPPETPPGRYGLQIGFYTTAPAVSSGELTFPTPLQPLAEPLQLIEVWPGPEAAPADGLTLFDLSLLSPTLPARPLKADRLNFDLIWLAPSPTEADYQAAFALVDQSGQARWRWPARPLIEFLPTSQWPAARPLRSQWSLPLQAGTPGGPFQLQLQLIDQNGVTIAHNLGQIDMPGRVRRFDLPAAGTAIDQTFEQAISIAGLDLPPDLPPGSAWPVVLQWQALAPLEEDYTVFLQLLGPDGQVVAQQDKAPLDGAAPTSSWTPGEVVRDSFSLTLPDRLPPGQYRLITGFYHFETGRRLQAGPSDFVVLGQWVR